MSGNNEITDEIVVLGKVAKAHGIKGELKIFPYSGHPENFREYESIFLSEENSDTKRQYHIDKCRVQGKYALLLLQESCSRNDAEELVGSVVSVLRNALPQLNDDEFYLADLEGREMITTEGESLGYIKGLLQTDGHDILAVEGKGREYLIPAIGEFLVRIEPHQVHVKIPPGLLDINKS